MTPTRIDHIAFGVDSTVAAADFLVHTFEAELPSGDAAAGRSVLVRLDGVSIELVSDPSCELRGHLAVAVADLEAARAKLTASGVRFVGEVVKGAGGSRNIWLNSEDSGGLRIHLCERPR